VSPRGEDSSSFINTIIGHGSTVRGEITVQGFVRVDGDLMGTLTTEGRVLVSPSGRIKGKILGRDLVIGGVIKGDVYATERILLLSSSLVIGNLHAPRVIIEQGSLVEGYCCFTPRIREEGVLHHQVQKSYTLNFQRPLAPVPLTHG